MSTKIEFAVQMTCEKCVKNIEETLVKVPGINNVDISLNKETVIVNTSLPSSQVQQLIESTGRRAVLKGYGAPENHGAAVTMLGNEVGCSLGEVKGIVRFIQINHDSCVIDGTIDGLKPGYHGLHVHECGDISQGCESVGDHFNLQNTKHGGPEDTEDKRHTGDLGNILADTDGRATFRFTDRILKVWDIIGRSLVVTENEDDLGHGKNTQSCVDGNSGKRLSCGIIARSAGLFENSKRICACDGVTLWDERDRPLAGPGRRNGNL